jgi:hypothetical protein
MQNHRVKIALHISEYFFFETTEEISIAFVIVHLDKTLGKFALVSNGPVKLLLCVNSIC